MTAAKWAARESAMSTSKKRSGDLKLAQVKRPVTIKEQVYLTLREQLLHRQPGPNGRIVEKQITDALGVSRTPVREALSLLASEGLLVSTHHGYKVPEFLLDDVLNVFEVRMLLEPVAARQAAENSSTVGLSEMRRAIEGEKAAHAKGDVTRFLRANSSFREHWHKRTRNPLLLAFLTRTVHSLQAIRFRTLSDRPIREFVIERHEALWAAIQAGKPDQAARVQVSTIQGFENLVRLRIFHTGEESLT
jgi:DNA-binding GntR family transcriptional regulator